MLRQSWRPVCQPETHPPDEKNRYGHSFHIIERIRDAASCTPQHEEDGATRSGTDPEKALEGLDLAAILARGNIGV